jgi:hypothetical protein
MVTKTKKTIMERALAAGVVIAIDAVIEDNTPVRGNAAASGDDAADKAVEDEILARLDRGDVWAWAIVHVKASFNGFEGHAILGGCGYADKDDFMASDYYGDKQEEALADLQHVLRDAECRGQAAAAFRKRLWGGA